MHRIKPMHWFNTDAYVWADAYASVLCRSFSFNHHLSIHRGRQQIRFSLHSHHLTGRSGHRRRGREGAQDGGCGGRERRRVIGQEATAQHLRRRQEGPRGQVRDGAVQGLRGPVLHLPGDQPPRRHSQQDLHPRPRGKGDERSPLSGISSRNRQVKSVSFFFSRRSTRRPTSSAAASGARSSTLPRSAATPSPRRPTSRTSTPRRGPRSS